MWIYAYLSCIVNTCALGDAIRIRIICGTGLTLLQALGRGVESKHAPQVMFVSFVLEGLPSAQRVWVIEISNSS